ncbi:MAG: Dephospho-CoA kinase (EC [uncultured Sulfurovum sp.]|uniref:Dephospho-CoA kinase n=1 Tax=uncultured Sulfurovum sp. TaxID=269237 RepID=A0A6S6SI43_9BACT|nr:MAG: Dephospho-CoA kinase (EC [uncultured Sulfurovum sp.]
MSRYCLTNLILSFGWLSIIRRSSMAFKYAVVLTGGIATGKSTVAKIFKAYGFKIIDADKIAHDMLDLQYQEIIKLFGDEYVLDTKVIRKKLGTLIFGNKQEKLRLEALLHPLIFKEIERQALFLDKGKKPYLVDIPLFFETNRYPIKESVVVYVPKVLQLERLMKRDGSSKKEAKERIDAQMDIEKKKQKASYLIDNQGNLKNLQLLCAKVKDKIITNYKEI